MGSLNKVQLIGNVGRDPEMTYMASGDAICNLSIATSENWKDKQGQKQELTEWHRCVAFKKLAEVIGEYVKKGSQIYVEGRLKTRKWEKDGVTRYSTEITVDRMQLLDRKGGDTQGRAPAPAQNRAPAPAPRREAPQSSGSNGGFDDMEDDIPF